MLASSSTTKIVPLSADKFLNAVPNERELLTLYYLLVRSQNRKTILKYSYEERSDRLILASVQQIMEYVAWWCPHCHEQKLLFGKEAYQIINDNIKVECDKRGLNAHPDWCDAAKIPGFPTWIINGHQYPGVQNLNQLAKASGYKGDTNFKYIHTP
jgi:hypothetical protein